jgi:hypothetical protein
LALPVEARPDSVAVARLLRGGKYAPGEANLREFVVEGEQRYWIHVAIDRFTGQVLDKQIEVVNE